MIKRTLLILTLLTLPAAALADTSTGTTDATQLGPSTNYSGTSSSADGTALQPASSSTTSLQQASDQDSTVLGQASSQLLTSPDLNQQQLQVIADSADGGPQPVDAPFSQLDWLWVSLVLAALVAGGFYLFRSRPVIAKAAD